MPSSEKQIAELYCLRDDINTILQLFKKTFFFGRPLHLTDWVVMIMGCYPPFNIPKKYYYIVLILWNDFERYSEGVRKVNQFLQKLE